VTVVIATRDRRDRVLRTLGELAALPAPPPVILVDNASRDGTPEAVAAAFPQTDIIRLPTNLGAAARNAGARAAATPLVALCDDDSWWAPGALERAAAAFARHPRLGLLAARILVGDEHRPDPTCAAMAAGPAAAGAPGPSIFGFVACGAVLRRDALLDVGGFDARFGIGGEETLLTLDLAVAGWERVYAEDVVAHHHPQRGTRPRRARGMVRNDLWTSWLRRPASVAARDTLAALRRGELGGVGDALRGLPWVIRERRRLPSRIEGDLRRAVAAHSPC
jgi:N-acetylglucosaminyl-diphospho-decaprenol L-rhamnosyltransferase